MPFWRRAAGAKTVSKNAPPRTVGVVDGPAVVPMTEPLDQDTERNTPMTYSGREVRETSVIYPPQPDIEATWEVLKCPVTSALR